MASSSDLSRLPEAASARSLAVLMHRYDSRRLDCALQCPLLALPLSTLPLFATAGYPTFFPSLLAFRYMHIFDSRATVLVEHLSASAEHVLDCRSVAFDDAASERLGSKLVSHELEPMRSAFLDYE